MEVNGNDAHIEPAGMEQFLEGEFDYKLPKRGDIRKGIILSISPEQMIVDIGVKKEGIVPAADLSKMDPGVVEKLSVGDEVMVSIERPSDREGDLIVSMHKAWVQEDWKIAHEYLEGGKVWEGTVSGFNKGGLIVPFGNLRGFIPASQLPRGSTRGKTREEQLKAYVGQEIMAKVIEVDQGRRRLILSVRAAEKESLARSREKLFQDLKEGEVRRGVVSSVCDFGVFVDLGGVDGLVHVSELSWRRVSHPKEVLSVGDEVEVYVLRVDHERQRIGLSIKRLQPEPWSDIDQRYEVDQLVEATITNIVEFGAFARVEEGVEGLIHISELSDAPINHPGEVVSVGDRVTLRILRIDAGHKRLGLSLKQAQEEEIDWVPAAYEDEDEVDSGVELEKKDSNGESESGAANEPDSEDHEMGTSGPDTGPESGDTAASGSVALGAADDLEGDEDDPDIKNGDIA